MMTFEPSREAGLERLSRFAPRAGKAYGVGRNYDRTTGRIAVSGLSPYLRHRLISEAEVLEAVLRHHSLETAMPFVQEVFWRGYFKGWLEQRPGVWGDCQSDLSEMRQALPDGYHDAIAGRSGIECFDHWVQQLLDTGYLHNHARMWVASIWIFTLGLPWQLGADFFLRHLVDADPASNTLSWRWVAGLHTKGKHYLATAAIIARFTDGRFNPVGQLNETAQPLSENRGDVLTPLPAPGPDLPAQAIWLVTEEDCLPPPAQATVVGVVGVVSPQAPQFAQQAVTSAVATAGGQVHLGHRWSDAILVEAQSKGVRDVVYGYLPTGPAADGVAAVRQRLSQEGVTLHLHQRIYDQLVWPHTSRGFFKLKKQIPTLIKQLLP